MSKKNTLVEDFLKIFSEKREFISKSINGLTSEASNNNQETTSKINSIANEIQLLKSNLHNSLSFLPSYSVKVRQDELAELEKCLKIKEDELIPKKKFGFKSKVANPVDSNKSNAEVMPLVDQPIVNIQKENQDNFFTIQELENTTLIYEEDQLNGNDVLIKNLKNVCLELKGSPSTLRISNLNGCKILCGPVATSIFVEESNNCKLYISCQQLRTHSSKDLDIYLYVKSRAIIEDCTNIRFGPYPWNHSSLTKWAQTEEITERFDFIDDFNWLSNTTPSPNWSLIKLEERLAFSC